MLREKLKPAAIFHSLLEQKVHHANTRIHRCTTHESQDWRLRKRAKNKKQVSLPVVELKSFVRWNFHCWNSPLTLYSRNFNSFSLLSFQFHQIFFGIPQNETSPLVTLLFLFFFSDLFCVSLFRFLTFKHLIYIELIFSYHNSVFLKLMYTFLHFYGN